MLNIIGYFLVGLLFLICLITLSFCFFKLIQYLVESFD